MKFWNRHIDFSEGHGTEPSDIGLVMDLSDSNKIELINYSSSTLEHLNAAIDRCDKKAISIVTIIISLSGALFLLVRENAPSPIGIQIVYAVNLLFVLVSVGISLASLVVRNHKLPPSIGGIVNWIKGENPESVDARLLATIILAMSTAEESHLKLLEKKARLLIWAQILGFLSVTCIFVSTMAMKIYPT